MHANIRFKHYYRYLSAFSSVVSELHLLSKLNMYSKYLVESMFTLGVSSWVKYLPLGYMVCAFWLLTLVVINSEFNFVRNIG